MKANEIIFAKLRTFSRYEQLILLQEELLTLVETFEEDMGNVDSDIIDLVSDIENKVHYERHELVWESIERKLKNESDTNEH